MPIPILVNRKENAEFETKSLRNAIYQGHSMKRILFTPASPANFRKAWAEQGYEPVLAQEDYTSLKAASMMERLAVYQKYNGITHVFTFNFTPQLAMSCKSLELWYVCWVWDCPHTPLWSKWAKGTRCCIFVFDYQQYQRLRQRGVSQSFYLPLCTDTKKFEAAISDGGAGAERYGADVSFVGNLYNDAAHSLFDQISYIPPYAKGYLEALMEVQQKIWGEDLLWEGVNDRALELLKKYVKWDLGENYENGVYEALLVNMLGQKVTQMERMKACSYLARHYPFALYTDSDTSFDPLIDNRGHVDYTSEMPLVFHHSKINIHITLRGITSGMSLRVLDVLACGGFLLTNYQRETAEYFENGRELVMYTDFQDLYQKISYYLEHEEERKAIAHAGYVKVREMFTYRIGVRTITEVLEGLDGQGADSI